MSMQPRVGEYPSERLLVDQPSRQKTSQPALVNECRQMGIHRVCLAPSHRSRLGNRR
jgi:hypothetical protein